MDVSRRDPASGPTPPRRGPRRDRRGRGPRGPAVLPGPLTSRPAPPRTGRDVFDSLVLAAVARLEERWREQLRHVEFAVEEVPLVPDDWAPDAVPLATLVRGGVGASTRLVVFRRPVEQRCEGRDELAALVTAVLVEQVAELLGLAPHEIDPGYEAD